jgi:hypothetical protein
MDGIRLWALSLLSGIDQSVFATRNVATATTTGAVVTGEDHGMREGADG